MAKFVHSMVRISDEARSLDYYRRALGLTVADRVEFPDFTLIYLRGQGSDFELELTVNTGRDKPYDLGDGYGHIALTVDDVAAEHARFQREGLPATDLKELKIGDTPFARFFFATDPDGYKIEVMQRAGRFV